MKISVLGATGSVGAPAAFHIAVSGLADEMLLIGGSRKNVLEHHAIDLSTAVATQDVTIRFGDYEDLTGTDIVVNVAGAHKPLSLDRNQILTEQSKFIADIARKIKKYCPDAVVISAVNPIDALNYAVYLAGEFDRTQLLGYSINDSYRFRESLAAELNVKV